MQTITLSWTETSNHEVTVHVPDNFDIDTSPYACDIANDVAGLDDDGFQGLYRREFHAETAHFDPDAPVLYDNPE